MLSEDSHGWATIKALALLAVGTTLAEQEVVLEAGHTGAAERADSARLMAQVPALKEALETPGVRLLHRKSGVSPSEIDAATKALRGKFQNEDKVTQHIRAAAAPRGANPTGLRAIAQSDLDRRLREYDELVAISKAKLDPAGVKIAVTERTKGQRDVLLKRISQVMNKKVETLRLKSGERVSGVVIQQGSNYLVLTPEGRRLIKGSEMAEIRF